MFYENTYHVDSRLIDPFGHCRPSALLGLLQEAATEAACALHVSRDETVAKYNTFWMLVRIWFSLKRPLLWDEHLRIRTWHRGGKGAAMYRDFDLFVGEEWVGEAVSSWVLATLDTNKIFRLSKVAEFAGTDGGELCKEKVLAKLRTPQDLPLAERRLLHYSEADLNGHINNVRYADFACDALRLEQLLPGSFVSQMQIGYLDECMPGEIIDLHAGEAEGRYFVHGVGAEGNPRFDAALELSPLP